jgi:radical SAM superfamily enzyme YgiQ (UPF0313 family)
LPLCHTARELGRFIIPPIRLLPVKPLIVDALASGRGRRRVTRDVIGAGPRSLAGVFEGRGVYPCVVRVEDALTGGFQFSDFDLLLVSGMTSDLSSVRHVVSRWRKTEGGPVIVGGPITSDLGVMRKIKIDIAVTGEGELTLLELLDSGLLGGHLPSKQSLSGIKGISYLKGSEIQVNPLRPVMERRDFEKQNPSTRVIVDYPLYHSARVYVEVLRGCSNYHRARLASPQGECGECDLCRSGGLLERYDCPRGIPPGCGYCSVPSLYGPPKSRSAERILSEIEGLLNRGVRRIVLSAPGFLDYGRDLLVEPEPLTDPRFPEPNYMAIDGLLSDISALDAVTEGEASFMIENLKGELVTWEAAEIIGRHLAGTPVNVGFETGCENHSIQIGRSATPEENLVAVKRLDRAGLKPYVYFVHGLPGQDKGTVDATVEAINESMEAGASRVILYRFQPLPMSAFHDRSKAPPAVRDRLSRRIYEAAHKANASRKEEMIGEQIRVVVAEPYDRDRRFSVAYPMLHGPVVLVEGVEGMDGEIVEVTVSRVVSNRIIEGTHST